MSVEIAKSEIVDWWGRARAEIFNECLDMEAKLRVRIAEEIALLSTKELLNPRSTQIRAMRRSIESDLNMFGKRLERRLEVSLLQSIRETEGVLDKQSVVASDMAGLVVGSAAAIGAVGLAASATTLATTTSATFLFFFGGGLVLSWPTFAAIGGVALSLTVISPKAIDWTKDRLKTRYISSNQNYISRLLIKDSKSIYCTFTGYLDMLRDKRLEQL